MAERKLQARFWDEVDRSAGPDGCWSWIGRRDRLGYGRYSLRHGEQPALPRQGLAHRLAVVLTGGTLGPVVRHTCDNPPCCNPKHLEVGTQAENLRDMWAKGRGFHPAGEMHPRARLSEISVHAIRLADLSRYGSGVALAHQHGVSTRTIYQVRSGERWSHVEEGGTRHR